MIGSFIRIVAYIELNSWYCKRELASLLFKENYQFTLKYLNYEKRIIR